MRVDRRGLPTKAEIELSALRAVFDTSAYIEVVASDAPDFLLTPRGAAPFGVEITEIFASDGHARIARQPGYLHQLLGPEPRLNRRDAPILEIAPVTVHDSAGNLKYEDLQVVLTKTPSPLERSGAIARAIESKAERARQYQSGLDHLSLVIVDHFFANAYKDIEPSTTDVLSDDVVKALTESPFHEVYVVRSKGGSQTVTPLRQLLVFSEFEIFLEVLKAFKHESVPHDRQLLAEEVVPLFVLGCSTLDVRYSRVRDEQTAVYYGTGIQFSDAALSILDGQETSFPERGRPGTFLSEDALASLRNLHKTNRSLHRLVTDFEFPVAEATFLLPGDRAV